MKQALYLSTAAMASFAAHAQTALPPQRLAELRVVVQQSVGAAGTPAMRQLSAEERAELRRQVQQSQRSAKAAQ